MEIIQTEIINTLKILIYKEDPTILEKIDFENDSIFLEPLLFTYFNLKKNNAFTKDILEEIMQGYFLEKKEVKTSHSLNKNEIAYIPNIGYFSKDKKHPFEKIIRIENTEIEVLKYSIKFLESIFKTPSGMSIKDEQIVINNELFEKNITFLTNALNFIKQNSSNHYKLIEQCCKKILMFKINPEFTNSFATINSHGMAFLNIYQDENMMKFFLLMILLIKQDI